METEDLIEPEQEQIEAIEQPSEVEAPETPDSIFADALKGKADGPEDVKPTEKDGAGEQVEKPAAKKEQTVSTHYGEITLDEAKKIAFKSEEEFKAFLERNPFLKERVLMQSDYTRKTTQVAEERKRFAEERKQFVAEQAKQSEAWGPTKPTDVAMSLFHDTWHFAQHGSPELVSRIEAFFQDIDLIAKNKKPVGPLAGQNGEAPDFSRDSQIVGVKRELETLKQEREREKREAEEARLEREQSEAVSEVNSWLEEKAKAGTPITQEERIAMARFAPLRDEQGRRFPLDTLYRWALADLGKTEKVAISKVFTGSKTQSAKTGPKPNSRASSGAKPAVNENDLGSILNEGLESLSE